MSLEQYFPMLYGRKHGFVKSLDLKNFEKRLRELDPLDKYFRVKFYGMENIPAHGGALIIGNHGPFGIDGAFVVKHVYEEGGRVVRPLGDRLLFKIPIFRVFLNTVGVLEGEADQAVDIMRAGELCSVYPGGYAETVKEPHEKYQVKQFWENHLGYIKVALRAQVPIIPISCIGLDDTVFQLKTAEQTSQFAPARFLQKYMEHDKYGVPLWMGLGLLPVPVQFTYKVGEAIDLGYGPEAADDPDILHKVNNNLIEIMEGMIEKGLDNRRAARAETKERFYKRMTRGPEIFHQLFGESRLFDPELDEEDNYEI
jgi:1-acyl-sn-glycerol-3-phosphate acyltransferase